MKHGTVKEALQRASFCLQESGVDQSRTEAEILLAHFLEVDRLRLIMNNDRCLSLKVSALYRDAISRRCQGEPVAYITGEKYFFGYRYIVNKDVLIPRPETELIVEGSLEWAVCQLGLQGQKIDCIDLGTGSGVLAVTLALQLPGATVWAVELYEKALHTAKSNAAMHGVEKKIRWAHGSFFNALEGFSPRPSFNLIVSNPPYLSRADMKKLPPEIKCYEPVKALYGGEDGLDSYRLILRGLSQFVKKPALVLLEIGAGQKEKVEKLCLKSGLFNEIAWRNDLAGWPRVMEGHIHLNY